VLAEVITPVRLIFSSVVSAEAASVMTGTAAAAHRATDHIRVVAFHMI
jgi:hypothetical protein